jgi:CheY-like chemotaxis protein
MRSILVVAEGPELRHRLAGVLSGAGYRVVEAESGERALELTPNVLPDVVLMAIVMRRLNGLETAVKMRKAAGAKSVSIILLGSLIPIGMDDEPLASLIDGYLDIDAPADDVLDCVNQQLH